ncbi:MMPL family transporter [bacterium]|nr:MMPL family transporter [Akkermansiaceae bacterium]MDB4603961.1 MMPL family transporter [bacterium]MDA7531996.1 MMPL family transporter [Akkermansiaceae bacterium]MDA7607813.1 MMPL family transporter [Akkermansiaceae bacterium]MDA7642700.1 MMPL family transporter [Akkermansiaceae bacterium]
MRRPIRSYLIFGIVLIISVSGLKRLSFATDVLEILPDGIPEVEALQVFREYFDDDHRVILLLKHDDEIFEEDVAELADHLKKSLPEARIQYRNRFDDDPKSFAKSLARLWADSDPRQVQKFTDRLREPTQIQALLAESKDKVALSLDQGEATMAAYDPLGFLTHPTMNQLQGNSFDYQSEDGRFWLVMIANTDLGLEYREHAKWVNQIRESTNNWKSEGFTYTLTGGPVFSAEIGSGMEKDMSGTITITSIIVGILFLLTQRSFVQLLVLGAILGLVFLITLGLAGWIYGTLNLVSVGFAAILLGLVIDYGVVIARESSAGQSPTSLRREMAPGILWAALTTAVVFGILMLSTFKGVQQLGGVVLIGLVVGAVICLWLMPLALQRFPRKQPCQLLRPPFPGVKLALAFLVILLIGSIGVFVSLGQPEIEFDVSMVEPEVSEAAQTLEIMQNQFPAFSRRNLSLVAKGETVDEVRNSLKVAEEKIDKLKESGLITRSEWPVEVLPNREARMINAEVWNEIAQNSQTILAEMERAGFNEKGRALDSLVLKSFADIPDELDPFARTFYHEDGFFSGRIQLKEIVTAETAKELQVLNTDDVTVSGWEMLRLLLLKRVKDDLYLLFIPATLVLLVALILVFRSWKDAVLTAGVLVTVLLLVNALVVVAGKPWNFLSSMAIPLIVGTGIDYSIHLIFALRRSKGDLVKVWNGVGKGIFFCGLSTVVGFGSLCFASNETLQSMGFFCGIGVLLTMTLSVIVVPTLWVWGHRDC